EDHRTLKEGLEEQQKEGSLKSAPSERTRQAPEKKEGQC
ncbi:hypothetical protein A2U01_0094267, partial [Trifolium medium]|nr:hypothetical protein [Trifolium medium]